MSIDIAEVMAWSHSSFARSSLVRGAVAWKLSSGKTSTTPAFSASLFPENAPSPVRRVGVVPHYWDRNWARSFADAISPLSHWQDVMSFILGCELVIASSLHALIVAEAFGIPARWWHSPKLASARTEGVFKYNDYYASTNRSLNDWASSVDEAIEMGGKEPIRDYDYAALIGAFPRSEFSPL